jgi:hypothetical protein
LCTSVATAFTLVTIPAVNAKPAELAQGSAEELGVISINLKDIVKPQVGVQSQTQAAGTPNEAGIGGFLPLVVGKNSVLFLDILRMPTSQTSRVSPASSTQMSVALPSPPHHGWVTAGSMVTAAGCMALMRGMTPDR